jgi:hypothetical protein
MKRTVVCLFGLFVGLALSMLASAQEGHPLVGTWYGDWGPTQTQRTQITVVLTWDGKNINGLFNPGPDAFPLKSATLDSKNWTVHLEADTKDGAHIVADGKLEHIGSYNRTLTGAWTQGSTKGDFKIKRD